jgi:hypothetical protein
MKAFEEWNQSHSACGNIMCPDMTCHDCESQRKIIREEVWRAALEWTLMVCLSGHQGCHITDDIKEELEEE